MKRKNLLIVISIVAGILVLAVAGLLVYSQLAFKRSYHRPIYPITADTSPEGLAHGKYLVHNVMACSDCHANPGSEAALSGRIQNIQQGPISAVLAGSNLTPDASTGLGGWSDGEIARAIREGVDNEGVELVVMPSQNYHAMSDADVAAIVGYLRSLEAVKNEVPSVSMNLPGKVLAALGVLGPKAIGEPITSPVSAPQPGTAEYGGYLVGLGGCRDCHGPDLKSGKVPLSGPEVPPGPDLTSSGRVGKWTQAEFLNVIRTGTVAVGYVMNPKIMPWPVYGKMTDEDLGAIYQYLHVLK